MRRLLFLLSVGCLLSSGGCTLIVATVPTKHFSEMLSEQPPRAKVEKLLGTPIQTQIFFYPASVPENYISYNRWDRPVVAESLAVYEYRGRADDELEFMEAVMVSAITFFVGEVYTFPYSIFLSADLSKRVHRYGVWYSPEGRVVGHNHFVCGPEPLNPCPKEYLIPSTLPSDSKNLLLR
jgi:hypothetical protein